MRASDVAQKSALHMHGARIHELERDRHAAAGRANVARNSSAVLIKHTHALLRLPSRECCTDPVTCKTRSLATVSPRPAALSGARARPRRRASAGSWGCPKHGRPRPLPGRCQRTPRPVSPLTTTRPRVRARVTFPTTLRSSCSISSKLYCQAYNQHMRGESRRVTTEECDAVGRAAIRTASPSDSLAACEAVRDAAWRRSVERVTNAWRQR